MRVLDPGFTMPVVLIAVTLALPLGAQCEVSKLRGSVDGAELVGFGRSVSVSGDLALVGASGDDDAGSNSGSAYVFRVDGSEWFEEAKLVASDAAGGDRFGISVALCGDVALVGAHEDDDADSHSGSAYVFRFDGTTWVEEQKLTDGEQSDEFGRSVSVCGEVALVGRRNENTSPKFDRRS